MDLSGVFHTRVAWRFRVRSLVLSRTGGDPAYSFRLMMSNTFFTHTRVISRTADSGLSELFSRTRGGDQKLATNLDLNSFSTRGEWSQARYRGHRSFSYHAGSDLVSDSSLLTSSGYTKWSPEPEDTIDSTVLFSTHRRGDHTAGHNTGWDFSHPRVIPDLHVTLLTNPAKDFRAEEVISAQGWSDGTFLVSN